MGPLKHHLLIILTFNTLTFKKPMDILVRISVICFNRNFQFYFFSQTNEMNKHQGGSVVQHTNFSGLKGPSLGEGDIRSKALRH